MLLPGVKVRILENVTAAALTNSEFDDINSLLSELARKPTEISRSQLITATEHSLVVVAQCSIVARPSIIGLGCLIVIHALTGRSGLIIHFVVGESNQRKGIESAMLKCLVEKAQELGLRRLDLPSGPSRVETHQFWLKHGFVKRDINMFCLQLE